MEISTSDTAIVTSSTTVDNDSVNTTATTTTSTTVDAQGANSQTTVNTPSAPVAKTDKNEHLSLPLTRVKRIITSDKEVNKVTAEAVFLTAKATVQNSFF